MPKVRKAYTRYQPNVPGANHNNFHLVPLSRLKNPLLINAKDTKTVKQNEYTAQAHPARSDQTGPFKTSGIKLGNLQIAKNTTLFKITLYSIKLGWPSIEARRVCQWQITQMATALSTTFRLIGCTVTF